MVSDIANADEQVWATGDHVRKFYDSDSNSYHDVKKNKNQNSNNTKSCKVISKLLLLEDLRFHIFTFVPLNCLLNSARYVCKHWTATIESSHFAKACERQARTRIGLYVEDCHTQGNSYFLEFKDFVNGQTERTNLGTPQRMGYIISTCDGILLLRNISKQIFFVNPILKCWLRIPNFPISQQHSTLGYECTIVRVPDSAKFKIFLVEFLKVSGDLWYIFYVSTIGTNYSWKKMVRKETTLERHFSCKPLYNGGNDIYWITKTEVIVMDVDKEIIVRECPLPHVSDDPVHWYLLMGNHISRVMSNDYFRTFQIYIWDFDTENFSLHHEMGPFDFMVACDHEVIISSMAFRLWINDQIIFQIQLLCVGVKIIHFGYNIKTRQLIKIGNIDVGDFRVWLHTNSLVSMPCTPI